MRLLFDQNLSFKLCARLADLFPGSTQARLLGLDRADDRTLWDHAAANDLAFVTQDADFAEMAVSATGRRLPSRRPCGAIMP